MKIVYIAVIALINAVDELILPFQQQDRTAFCAALLVVLGSFLFVLLIVHDTPA